MRMSLAKSNWMLICLILSLLIITTGLLEAQTKGRITGRVTDANTEEYLPGANVMIEGTSFGSATDRAGKYRIENVPPGTYTLTVSYIGYDEFSSEITVTAGATVEQDVELNVSYVEAEEIVVQGLRQGQVKALSQQRSSNRIVNVVSSETMEQFPDPNAADALQRIPGISVTRDHGEGRYILVRGTEPRLNSTMINGERIPSPEDDNRNVSLDVIPSNLFNSIEVSKALTPDMDADAIGGSVNLITKNAFDFDGPVLNFNVSGGYRNLRGDGGGRAAFTYGNQFMDNKLGFIVSGSYENNNMGTDNIEMSWDDSYKRVTDVIDVEASSELDDGEYEIDDEGDTTWVYETEKTDGTALDEVELRHYDINRQRMGITGNLDYKLNENSSFYLRTIYNLYNDTESRNLLGFRYGDSVDEEEPESGYQSATEVHLAPIERELKYRKSKSTIYSLSLGGIHNFSGFEMDYNLSTSYAEEDRDPSRTYVFKSEEYDLKYNISDPNYPQVQVTNGMDYNDLSGFEFDEAEQKDGEKTFDRNTTVGLNAKIPFNIGSASAYFKFGGKFRNKEKESDKTKEKEWKWDGDEDLVLSDFSTDIEGDDFMDGNYDHNLGIDHDEIDDHWNNNKSDYEIEDVLESKYFETWDASEKVTAFYGMFDVRFGDISVLAGSRTEMTKTKYNGYTGNLDEEDDIEKAAGENDYTNWLPMIHLRYNFNNQLVLRTAFTSSLARPNYYDLVPYRMLDGDELALGNPLLEPTSSKNIDLMAEYYVGSIGIISGGFFHKILTDYIYYEKKEDISDDISEQVQPVNGEDATLTGFEINWQQQLTFLPGALDGLGIYLNYTYTTSEAKYIDRDPTSLPGQADHIGNFSLSYEKFGFTARLSVNYHGKYVFEIEDDKDEDVYYNNHTQVDLSTNYRLTKKIILYGDFLNLTNEPLLYYSGVKDRPIQRELYSFRARLGVKYDF